MTHKLLHFTSPTISIQNSESKFLSSQINVNAMRATIASGRKYLLPSVKRYRTENDAFYLVDLMEFIRKTTELLPNTGPQHFKK